MRVWSISMVLLLVVSASTLRAQPSNHIGEPLANVMIAAGCALTETEVVAGLEQIGYGISDYQAQVLSLYNSGFLGRLEDGRLQLRDWPPCA